MSDTTHSRSGERTDHRPDFVAALGEALARYAQDVPLIDAVSPLLEFVADCEPAFEPALVRWSSRAQAVETVCPAPGDPALDPKVLKAAAGWWERPVSHVLRFDPLLTAQTGEPVFIAGLQITDDHASGALLLIARPGETEAAPNTPDSALQAASRALALFVQERASSAALTEGRAALRTILDMAPDAIVRIDHGGTIKTFNRAAERMFGYAAAEAIGQPVSILMTAEHASRHAGYVDRYVRSGERRLENWRRRLTARCRNGGEIPIEIALGDTTLQGEPCFIGVIRDISDRVREEARRDALRQALEHATQLSALGEMAATIAHEVNQPLTAVGNYVDAALAMIDAGEPVEDLRRTLQLARAQAGMGGEIVRRVRRLTTRRAPERSVTDINEAAEETLDYLQKVAAAHGATVLRDYASPAPVVFVDRIQLQQVIANLVRNALQAVSKREDGAVTVRTRADDQGVILSVLDNGPGLPDDVRATMFDSFVTGSPGGVGLGLAVSRTIAEQHGGTIWAEDNAPSGAAFHLRLPFGTGGTDPGP